MKRKRIKNAFLLREIKKIPCLVCQQSPSDPDHITTVGAGGDDVPENVWPLCRGHHTERHKIGLITFIHKYRVLRLWLKFADREDILDQL